MQAIGVYLPFVANGVGSDLFLLQVFKQMPVERSHKREETRRGDLWRRSIVVQVHAVHQHCRRVAAMARSPAVAVRVL